MEGGWERWLGREGDEWRDGCMEVWVNGCMDVCMDSRFLSQQNYVSVHVPNLWVPQCLWHL